MQNWVKQADWENSTGVRTQESAFREMFDCWLLTPGC
jgi:hypothetical protein